MVRRFLVSVLVILTAGTALSAQPSPPEAWAALTARLERAALEGSVSELRAVRGELLKMLAVSPQASLGAEAQYAIAYLAWRMAFLTGAPERERDDLLEDAVARLTALVKADPANAEAQALLGGVYGSQIGRSPIKGILLGPRASAALERAAERAAGNPRVALLQGIGAFNTPAMFGGGDEKADRLLRRSVDLFGREPAGAAWPNWGQADAHAWLGQLRLRQGDRAAARAEYDKALATAPHFGWVKHVLLPAVGRREKP